MLLDLLPMREYGAAQVVDHLDQLRVILLEAGQLVPHRHLVRGRGRVGVGVGEVLVLNLGNVEG